jgi:hypothetical protein
MRRRSRRSARRPTTPRPPCAGAADRRHRTRAGISRDPSPARRDQPERHTADLARSFRQAATARRDAGHTTQANHAYRKAITIERDLVSQHPDHNTFTALVEIPGRSGPHATGVRASDDALAPAHVAARLIDWHTSDTRPENLLPAARSLATVLHTIADVLDANGHHAQARARARARRSEIATRTGPCLLPSATAQKPPGDGD